MFIKSYRLLIIALVLGGTWQLGQGLYIHAKALLAQQLLEHAWHETQQGQQQVKPWPWADAWPVARMTVPRLGVDLIVLEGDSGRNLAFAPGHNPGSVLPGDTGNSFISAHRDTHFRFLQYLEPGDIIDIQTGDGKMIHYRVENSRVVDAAEARVRSSGGQSRLILVTCYPFDAVIPGGQQRYLVSAVDQSLAATVKF